MGKAANSLKRQLRQGGQKQQTFSWLTTTSIILTPIGVFINYSKKLGIENLS